LEDDAPPPPPIRVVDPMQKHANISAPAAAKPEPPPVAVTAVADKKDLSSSSDESSDSSSSSSSSSESSSESSDEEVDNELVGAAKSKITKFVPTQSAASKHHHKRIQTVGSKKANYSKFRVKKWAPVKFEADFDWKPQEVDYNRTLGSFATFPLPVSE